jgi:hypothetical protein
MTTSALRVAESYPALDKSAPRIRFSHLIALTLALGVLSAAAAPLTEGLVVGGRAAVAEKLSAMGARVEDFVPEDRGKVSKPILSGLLTGAATAVGEKVATVLVDASWPPAQAWLDRTTRKTDFMVWAGPDHFVDGKPVGRDDTLMNLKFEGNGNLALAYRLSRLFATLGFDVGKFKMSGSAQRTDCACSYRSHGNEIEVSTSGLVRQTWVSEKMGVIASIEAKMDDNGQAAAGKVNTSFDKVLLERPVVFGSSHDDLRADKRLDHC